MSGWPRRHCGVGDVKSWCIQYDVLSVARRPRQAASGSGPARAAGAASDVPAPERGGSGSTSAPAREAGRQAPGAAGGAELRPLQTRRRVTTGLFDVVESDGNPIQVVLLVSS